MGWFVWVGLWVELINFATEGRNIILVQLWVAGEDVLIQIISKNTQKPENTDFTTSRPTEWAIFLVLPYKCLQY